MENGCGNLLLLERCVCVCCYLRAGYCSVKWRSLDI